MLCKSCGNILVKSTANGLRYTCSSCGAEYPTNDVDTLISSSDRQGVARPRGGRSIWAYPANPKIFKKCPKCDAEIVAWENDTELNRIYGCECDYSWIERIQTAS